MICFWNNTLHLVCRLTFTSGISMQTSTWDLVVHGLTHAKHVTGTTMKSSSTEPMLWNARHWKRKETFVKLNANPFIRTWKKKPNWPRLERHRSVMFWLPAEHAIAKSTIRRRILQETVLGVQLWHIFWQVAYSPLLWGHEKEKPQCVRAYLGRYFTLVMRMYISSERVRGGTGERGALRRADCFPRL